MNFLESLNQNPIVSSIVYLCLAAFTGIILGKLKFKGIGLGIAGVLFTGLLIGHLGIHLNPEILHFVKEFGLILFVFSIGLEVGPGFRASIKSQGLYLNMFATLIVFLGFATAYVISLITDMPKSIISGILCGAVTNTPGLGAAQQALSDMGLQSEVANSGTGYAIAYPFGIIGIILTMILLRVFFKISVKKETDDYNSKIGENKQRLESVRITITNPNLINKKIEFLRKFIDNKVAISRIERQGEFIVPREDTLLEKHDIVYGVTNKTAISDIELLVGDITIYNRKSISGKLTVKDFIVTNKDIAGKTISQLGIYRRYPANITRIYRAGVEIMPSLETTIEFGDSVRVVGETDIMNYIKNEIGNSKNELAHPNVVPIFIGIFLGVILGSIPIFVPGLPSPVKLGLAGGPLIVALYLGHKQRIGKMNFYLTPGANFIIREIGIVLFLACVGLGSGANFWHSLVNGGYMYMAWGACITFFPIFIVAIISRLIGYNYLTICGFVAGSMTDPPALGFANSMAKSQAQSTAYATVYPLVMILRIMTAQILVFIC